MEPRKRKRLLLAFAGIVAFGAGLWLLLNRNAEPSYQGRKLSEWIAVYSHRGVVNEPTVAERDEAARAIRALGTNALPCLLEWIAHEQAPWRYQLGRLAERLPAWLTNRLPLEERLTDDSQGEMRAVAAMNAFVVLGPIAEPVLPELEQLLQRTNALDVPGRALYSLAGVGSAAVPIMTNALVQPHFAGKHWVMVFDVMGTNARALTPLFASQLTHTNDSIAEGTAFAFMMIDPTNHVDADLLVPALIRCLQDPRPDVREQAFFPLQTLGPAAAPALPALTNALNDPDPEIRAAARDAIEAITSVASP